MDNNSDGADAMVLLNMEVEKRILQALINAISPETVIDHPDAELNKLRYEAQNALGYWMASGMAGGSRDMQSAVRMVAGQMLGAPVSLYDSQDTARYSVETAIRTMLNGHTRVMFT